jgi:hypothetical protein
MLSLAGLLVEKWLAQADCRRFGCLLPSYNEMRAFDEAPGRCAREIERGEFDLLFATTAPAYQ